MKKAIYILTGLAVIFCTMSCSKNFLDLNPVSNLNVQGFYNNQEDFTNAMYGAYSVLRRQGVYNDDVQLVGELRSDNAEMGTTAGGENRDAFDNMSKFRLPVDNAVSNAIWNDNYLGIASVNGILGNIDDLDAPVEFKQRVKGEAQFLRALFYFNLVRVFGDVPLVTEMLNNIKAAYEKKRVEKTKVYDKIIEDLKDASEILPLQVSKEEGRATKGAALALLGKVYLTIHSYGDAKTTLERVFDLQQYQLLLNYGDLWEVANKNNKESIFDVQFARSSTSEAGSRFLERYSPYLYPYLSYSSTAGGFNIPTEDLINAYEPGDLRKVASLRESYIGQNGNVVTGLSGRFCFKFHDVPVQGQGSNDNWPVIRYADVILMYAEALNELGFEPGGAAFTNLNLIRSRAGLENKSYGNANPALAINNQEEFRDAVLQERRVELAFEGHRWYDLVRTGKAISILSPKKGVEIKEYQLVLPVPLSQIDINPEIDQNPGY